MNDSVSRLAWALPLVLIFGVIAILLLKRGMHRLGVQAQAHEPMQLRQSLELASGQQAHLLNIDGHSVLVVTSNSQPAIQVLSSTASTGAKNGWAWMRSPRR